MQFNRSLFENNKKHFKMILCEMSIAEYYQIIPTIGSLQFNIDFTDDGRYKFTVIYKTKYIPKYNIIKLPVEMNDIINSYLDDYIILNFIVDLTCDFPFSKPIWNLMSVDHSYYGRLSICLFEYYKYIVDLHNDMYNEKNNWSPIMNIKSDILKIICRINHFEIFADY